MKKMCKIIIQTLESKDTHPDLDAFIFFKKVHSIDWLEMNSFPTSKTFNLLDGWKSITKKKDIRRI